ncbi:carbonic anhydrase [Psychrobacter sp. I-STPA10]|uniref:carbonic anhydrase n=1 Tax=Psychrobacter sp. I-STPA10 TaxID=2585769 RepID=UPI001E2B601B|nr:carbonic anhydrase family protein [Psychrobacter sp. I-STPA10]
MQSHIKLLTLSTSLCVLGSIALTGCNNHKAIPTVNVATTMPTIDAATASDPTIEVHTNALHETVIIDTKKPLWSYAGTTGPAYWGDAASHSLCSEGKQQSPVNIQQVKAASASEPMTKYGRSDLNILNNHHTVVYTPTDENNVVMIDGEQYTLKQFHYHTPSEHQIGGKNFPAEVHFVNANAAGDLAVIGVMLNPTGDNETLDALLAASIAATDLNDTVLLRDFDINGLLPKNSPYYHYSGSLTTPPCSEQVQWYVMGEPLAVSQQEVQIMMQLFTGNNRPVEPLGDREIEKVGQ